LACVHGLQRDPDLPVREVGLGESRNLLYTRSAQQHQENAMSRQYRTQLVLGVLLILLGLWFFAVRQIPALRPWLEIQFEWPFYVVGAGVLLLFIGLLTGAPAMAIPACIVAGIGGILYYQNRFSDWESWSFLWTLIPGFVGIGTILTGLFGEDTRHNVGHGINLVVISAVMFLVFAAVFQRLSILGPYGPAVLLILLGLYVIGRGFLRSRGSRGGQNAAG
jgi:hypothetical protein